MTKAIAATATAATPTTRAPLISARSNEAGASLGTSALNSASRRNHAHVASSSPLRASSRARPIRPVEHDHQTGGHQGNRREEPQQQAGAGLGRNAPVGPPAEPQRRRRPDHHHRREQASPSAGGGGGGRDHHHRNHRTDQGRHRRRPGQQRGADADRRRRAVDDERDHRFQERVSRFDPDGPCRVHPVGPVVVPGVGAVGCDHDPVRLGVRLGLRR